MSNKDYRSLINLQPPIVSKNLDKNFNYDMTVREILNYLTQSSSSIPLSRYSVTQQRAFIRELLTIRDVTREQPYPSHIYDLIDQMLIYERIHMKTLTNVIDLPIQFAELPQIRVWRGDITTLVVDAIVNAGNSGLLGCFQPTHLCIDNVIHAAAGPRLRDDCYRIMTEQRHSEPVGLAKITLAYNLPSKYVLHTVGPQLTPGQRVTEHLAQQLASCYKSCLDLAAEMDNITSIAFCCISTGLFSFPAQQACRIATTTVINWFNKQKSKTRLSLVVFNVFNSDDEQFYINQLKSYKE